MRYFQKNFKDLGETFHLKLPTMLQQITIYFHILFIYFSYIYYDLVCFLSLKGYIKINFTELKSKFSNMFVGCITDGEFKLEVHISKNNNVDEFTDLKKGNLIQIVGVLKIKDANQPPILMVKKFSDIKLFKNKPKMSMHELLNGYKYIP